MAYCYTHELVHPSNLIREASCHRRQLSQRPTENKRLQNAQPQKWHISHPVPKAQRPPWKGGRKILRSRRQAVGGRLVQESFSSPGEGEGMWTISGTFWGYWKALPWRIDCPYFPTLQTLLEHHVLYTYQQTSILYLGSTSCNLMSFPTSWNVLPWTFFHNRW